MDAAVDRKDGNTEAAVVEDALRKDTGTSARDRIESVTSASSEAGLFTATIDFSGSTRYGMRYRVESEGIRVTLIKVGGLLDQWNSGHADSRIKVGALFLEINGVRGGRMHTELLAKQVNRIRVRPPAICKGDEIQTASKQLSLDICSKAADESAKCSSVLSPTATPPLQRQSSLKDAAKELEKPKELVFELPRDRRLGIRFGNAEEGQSHSVLSKIKSEGLMADWNASCPAGSEVGVGAHLLAVNGVCGTPKELHAEIMRSRGGTVKLLMRIGHRYNSDIRAALEEVYRAADDDASGVLSLDEFNACVTLVALELGQELDEDGVEAADEDGSGYLDHQEFLDYCFALCERCRQSSDCLLGMFRRVITEINHRKNHKEEAEVPYLLPSRSKLEAAMLEAYGDQSDDDDESED